MDTRIGESGNCALYIFGACVIRDY